VAQPALAARFTVFAQSNAQNPGVTPTFDQVTEVNLGGSLVFSDTINPGGLAGQSLLAVPAQPQITTFT